MFYLVAVQQEASGRGALIVGLVSAGQEQVVEVTTPDAARIVTSALQTAVQGFHQKARNVVPWHGPRENRAVWTQKD